jgi:hypothetical protein
MKKLTLICAALLWAAPAHTREVTVNQAIGSVTVRRSDRVWNARPGQRMSTGYALTTGGYSKAAKQYSKASIKLDLDQGIVLFGPVSRAQVSSLFFRRGGAVTRFRVNYGNLWAKVRRFTNPHSEFSILWPGGIVQVVRGTEFGTVWEEDAEEGVMVTKAGNVAVFDGETSTVVSAGEGVLVRKGEVVGPVATRQELGVERLEVNRNGAWFRVSGQVVINHCVLDRCVGEPVEIAAVQFGGKCYKVRGGVFRIRVKPPIGGNGSLLRIFTKNRQGIIRISGGSGLPRYP